MTGDEPEHAQTRHQMRGKIFETMMDAYAAVNMAGTIIDFNQAFLDLLGYGADEIERLSYEDITPGKWHDFELRILAQQVKTRGYSDLYEKEYRRKDGSVFPVELKTFLVKDEHGQDLAMWAIVRDISDRKRAEAALRESESKFRNYIDRSPEGVLIFDERGRFIEVNAAASRITGYSESELLSMSIADISPVGSATQAMRDYGELAGSGQSRSEIEFLHKDGTIRWWSIEAVQLAENIYLGFARDKTAQKLAQLELEETQKRYRALVEWTPMAIAVHREGRVVFVNPAAVRLMGATSTDELIGKPILEFVHPDYRQTVMERAKEASENNISARIIEEKFLRLDGTTIDVEVQGTQIVYEGEPAVYIVGQDITGRKRAENAIRNSESKYRQLAETLPLFVATFLPDGTLTYVNARLAATVRMSADDLIGRKFFDFLSEEDCVLVKARISELTPQNPIETHEQQYAGPNGESIYHRWTNQASFDGEGRATAFQAVGQDITESKEAESALRESEKFSRAILNSVGAEIAVVDCHGTIIRVNNAWLDFAQKHSAASGMSAANTGVGANYLEACKTTPDAEGDDSALSAREGIRAVLNGRLPHYSMDYSIHLSDGPHWFTMSATPLGEVGESVVISHTEITARKLAEEHVARSMRWWRALYDHLPIAAYVWEQVGDDWQLISHNAAASGLTGGKIHEMLGARASQLYADSPEILEAFSACREPGVKRNDSLNYTMRSSGEIKRVSVTYTSVPEKYVLVTVQDETEITKSHSALARSEAHMRLIADAFPGPVSHIGSDGRYSYVNRHYETWFGERKEDVIGRTPAELLNSELFTRIDPYFQKVLKGDQVNWETNVKTTDGRLLVGQVTHLPDFDGAGLVRGIFTIVFDITARKQAEEALLGSLQQKEMLLAEVHHRVKNNLQVITSLIGMQSHLIQDTSALIHLESLSLRIRAMGLLHTMLYKSPDLGSVSMRAYLEAIAEQVFTVHGRFGKGVALATDIEDEILLNIETALPIGLIVNETISNALKYAFGTVDHPQIAVSLRKTPVGYRLGVCDNGRGIGNDVDKRSSLGLRLVEVLCKQLHGELRISSDNGTHIYIDFQEQHKESKRWENEKS